jgi:hypothetical protein
VLGHGHNGPKLRNPSQDKEDELAFSSLPPHQHAAIIREGYNEFVSLVELNAEEWIHADESSSVAEAASAQKAVAQQHGLPDDEEDELEIHDKDEKEAAAIHEALAAAVSHERYKGSLRWSIDSETLRLVERIKRLPRVVGSVESDKSEGPTTELRYEALICRLVKHVRWLCINNNRTLTLAQQDLSAWILDIFHKMIDDGAGGGEDGEGGNSEQARCDMQSDLDSCDVTTLVLELVASAKDQYLVNQALRLGHSLLNRKGGNKKVQANIIAWCEKGGTVVESFFAEVRRRIDSLPAQVQSINSLLSIH